MKVIAIIIVCLFPMLSMAQNTEKNECIDVRLLKGSSTIYTARKIPADEIPKIPKRVLASHLDLVALKINTKTDGATFFYAKSMNDLGRSQLIFYSK